MKRFACVAGTLAVLGAATLSSVWAGDDEKVPTIKYVMAKLHKGANPPLAQLKAQLKSDTPDWDKVQGASKDFVMLGASLTKNMPAKGGPDSWKTLATKYFEDAKAIDDAAAQKDLKAARAAFGKLSTSCKACHSVHKGK